MNNLHVGVDKQEYRSAPLSGVERFRVYTERHMDQISQLQELPESLRFSMQVVASVLPFRVNQYVIDEMIDWQSVPNDPIFRLTFPQPEMLSEEQFDRMAALHRGCADKGTIRELAQEIRGELNPHPAGQMELNVPQLDGQPVHGLQHKYRETALFFPSQGQTCHSFCTFCFRWAQFVGDSELRFSSNEVETLHRYLEQHTEISDLLLTGGDPLVMKTRRLEEYISPLTSERFSHITNIRLGTKSLAFWPQRFVSDSDADDLLYLMERTVRAGKHIAVMAHFNHWRELESPITQRAISRIIDTGAVIRSQSPLIAHINDSAETWSRMWRRQMQLGIVPYYMFVARNTGAKRYFELPLVKAWEIYRDAITQVSGLGRTARGPSMSTAPGKVEIQGISEIHGEKVFVLRFIQARSIEWVQRPFFAKFDANATWLDQLQPAFGEEKFFFEDEFRELSSGVEQGW